jgi:hypothetical protein
MGLRVTRKLKRAMTKEATTKAGVAALNPLVDVSTSLCITSGLRTFEWLQFHPEEAARFCGFKVCEYAFYIHHLVLING